MDVRRKRNDNKKKFKINFKILAIVVISLIIVFSAVFLLKNAIKGKREIRVNETDQEINELIEEIDKEGQEFLKPDDEIVNISIVGGIYCDEGILDAAYNDETDEYNFYNSFNRVTNRTLNADISIGTLNTNFVEDANYISRSTHNAPEELANTLRLIGVDILSTATNYSYDFGINGIESTKTTLEENHISSIGTYDKEEESGSILIKEVGNIKIAFLAYTYKTDKNIPKANAFSVNKIDKDKMKQDLEKAKENGADFIFVNIHWGDEKSKKVTNSQKEIADFLIENGADFIIGSHPIYVEPMEMRKNSEGKDVLIAYSLGNYLSSEDYKGSNIGLTLSIQLTKSAETGEKYLSKVVYNPVYIIDNGKEAVNRYEILDIRSEIKKYQDNDKEKVTEETYQKLVEALNEVDDIIGGNE